MGLNHFPGCAGVLALSVIIKIAPANRRQMKQHRERDQRNEKRVTQRRRIQRRRIEQGIFNTERTRAGGHRLDSARYLFQSSGNRTTFPSGICTRATICRHSAITELSTGRVIRNAHQKRARSTSSSHASIASRSPTFAGRR